MPDASQVRGQWTAAHPQDTQEAPESRISRCAPWSVRWFNRQPNESRVPCLNRRGLGTTVEKSQHTSRRINGKPVKEVEYAMAVLLRRFFDRH
jgi:hypothetical protein